jgi:hypothetical protein
VKACASASGADLMEGAVEVRVAVMQAAAALFDALDALLDHVVTQVHLQSTDVLVECACMLHCAPLTASLTRS